MLPRSDRVLPVRGVSFFSTDLKVAKQMRQWTVAWGGNSFVLGQRTLVMGVLNVTPDSFSDGGRYLNPEVAAAQAWRMVEEGADLVDVGGESTRPGHSAVSATEEMGRILPVVRELRATGLPVPICVDTHKAAVAAAALEAGAEMINDVWGFQADPDLARVVAAAQVPVVLMHNQHGTCYQSLMDDIIASLERSITVAEAAGIRRDLVVIDPGIGFGKTAAQNLDVLRELAALRTLDRPILVGTSRKSTIGKVLGLPPDQRVEGTAATVAIAIAHGADVVRVHDVQAMVRVARMTDAIMRPNRGGWMPE